MLSLILIIQNAIYSSGDNLFTTPKKEIKRQYHKLNESGNSDDNLNASSASANPDLSCKSPQPTTPERDCKFNFENVLKISRPKRRRNPTFGRLQRTKPCMQLFATPEDENNANLRKEAEMRRLNLDNPEKLYQDCDDEIDEMLKNLDKE